MGFVCMLPPFESIRSAIRWWLLIVAISGVCVIACPQKAAWSRAKDGHWAFQPIERPAVPSVANNQWPTNPIDHFILARLERQGIHPSPAADRFALLRRLALDLTGLPPTVSAVEALAADRSVPGLTVYERQVNDLLASHHFGERWARHWLDVARYADSDGRELDLKRDIWHYRDWVITAVNADKPYDEFIVEQIGGDLLPKASPDQKTATGFSCNALAPAGHIEAVIVDRVNALGTAFLGLSFGCAQCHDHKFDPISQREFYELYAFFNQAKHVTYDLAGPGSAGQRAALKMQIEILEKELLSYEDGPSKDPFKWAQALAQSARNEMPREFRTAIGRHSDQRTEEQKQLIRQMHTRAQLIHHRQLEARLDAWAARMTDQDRDALPPEARAYLETPLRQRPNRRPASLLKPFWQQDTGLKQRREVIDELRKRIPNSPTTLVMMERFVPAKTHVFIRGVYANKGEEVTPNVPRVLPPMTVDNPNRLDLARWVASRNNPLTARVVVNRIWQRYFGTGIVETSENFGTQGDRPSHPDLLDWLASELIEHGWSLKHIHRLIVTSSTYRQASRLRPELAELDPDNRLLARQNRLRVEAEIIRDLALSVSGLLDGTIGGPSVFPRQTDGVMAGRADHSGWTMSTGAGRYRRGMYTHFWRLTPHPFLKQFDAPDATMSCSQRMRSNTPLQALTLLNNRWFTEAAIHLAHRVLREGPENDTEKMSWAFQLCLARDPAADELVILERLLQQQTESFRSAPKRAHDVVADSGLELPESDLPQLVAWTAVARTLLNLDEFITRQ